MKTLLLLTVMLFSFLSGNSQNKALAVGDAMPAFSLTDQYGKTFNSTDYVGKKVLVLFFYPKDESPVCTKEACSFRDSYSDFKEAGAVVAGINFASPEVHKKFADHQHLPYTLLSDPDNLVLKKFGVQGKLIATGRETFVIDLHGKIAYKFDAFLSGSKHAEETLAFVRKAAGK